MGDKKIGVGRSVRVAEFCQYVQDQKAVWDKAFAAEGERCRLLDEGDRKYYEKLEKDTKAALEKHLREVGASQTGARAGEVLK